MGSDRPSAAVWAGLATIYLIWGSTYLAVDLGIRTIPPLLMMSARHVIAGAILLVWASRRGALARRPRPGEWGAAGVVGGFLFLGGHGSLSWASRRSHRGSPRSWSARSRSGSP
jgi:drug/metabolite transporter (DMT)-like permease